MAASLDALPPELLTMIAEVILDDVSFRNHEVLQFRATCRAVNAAIHRIGVRAYFAVRTVRMDPIKIANLRQVAEVPEFASATKTLAIECDKDEMTAESCMQMSSLLSIALRPLRNVKCIAFVPPPECSYDQLDDTGVMQIDFSGAFSIALLAAQACEIQPQSIHALPEDSQTFESNMRITNCRSMELLTGCFTHLTFIDLVIEVDREIELPRAFAKDLAAGLNMMKRLTFLSINFSGPHVDRAFCFEELVERVHLPSITRMHASHLSCHTAALIKFFVKHTKTLSDVNLHAIRSVGRDGLQSFRTMLQEMQATLRLNSLETEEPLVSDMLQLDFPQYAKIYSCESEYEDGDIDVSPSDVIKLEGQEEVNEGLNELLRDIILKEIRF